MSVVGETLARHLSCFGELPASDRAAICAVPGDIREAKRLRDVLRTGDRPTAVVVVLSGLLYRYTVGSEGVRQIHSFYLPSEAPCLETLYLDRMDTNLGAVVDSRVGLIPHEALYKIIDERPSARALIWRQTVVQASIFRQWLVRNSKLPAQAALAHFLCEMFARAKVAGLADDDSCQLPVTQELVADALGITPVHVNRTLQVLRETGAVQWRGRILTVTDWPRLQLIAGFDPNYLHLNA